MTETAKEYAVALFELARETGSEAEIWGGLEIVRSVFAETPGFVAFLRSPGISEQVKLETIRSAFGSSVPEYVESFLCLLCHNGEAGILDECIAEYELLFHEEKNLVRAVVTSAVKLTDAEKQALRSKLEKKHKTKLEIEYRIDPSLIGGLVIEMDGTVLDGSLGRRLQLIKEVMEQ